MRVDKNIIGVTGNIATGKSVVRRMLANSGALEIDADTLAHRLIYRNGSSYHDVVAAFGKEILTDDGQISRSKLGEIVFSDPDKLQLLETLTHPAVRDAILTRIRQAQKHLVVIEAIKLLEAGLDSICTSVWVSYTSRSQQLERLMQTRNMTKEDAEDRINIQPPQRTKLARADILINTEGSFKATWEQIQRALNDTIQVNTNLKELHFNSIDGWTFTPINQLPQDQLEAFWQFHCPDKSLDLYEQLGTHRVLPLLNQNELTALLIWDNWNFTATMQKLIPPGRLQGRSQDFLALFLEQVCNEGCEIILLPEVMSLEQDFHPAELGFEQRRIEQIGYPAWQQAIEKMPLDPEGLVWSKVLTGPIEINCDFLHD